MSAPAANARRRWLFVPAVVIALALGVCLGALATYSVLGYEPASSESDAEHNHDHDHAHDEHDDHAHDDHSSEDHAQGDDHGSGSIELSAQARRNIGLVVATVEKRPFDRSILVPAMVVERPGRSELDVTAALGGIVTRIYPIQGEAVAAGAPLFDLRLTHEELVQSQSDFLKTANELDVVRREVRRLEPLEASGSIAIKTILDRRYEQEKLEAVLRSQHQALLLHGLSEAQINTILVSRQLLSGLTITVPESDEYENVKTRNTRAAPLFQVQQLFVEKGQFVNAGDQLCILSDHAQVYIEGRAFEQDAPALNQAAEKGWPITAVFEVPQGRPTLIDGLTILYVADRVEPESRTLRFFLLLPNHLVRDFKADDGRRFIGWQYKPGQRLQVRLPVEHWTDRIVLPAEAVVQDGAEMFVFREDGKHFDRMPVHVEYRDPQWAVIADDGSLKVGEQIAMAGAAQLQLALKNRSGGAVDPHAGHNH